MITTRLRLSLIAFLLFGLTIPASAQQAASPVDDQGRVVQFRRDIAPIFASRCLECHNAKNAKNDFRIDTPDSIVDYIEAGDSGASSLMTEYLLSEDPDMLMPPASHKGPLSPAELALVRVWIDEGADWPEGYVVRAAGVAAPLDASGEVSSGDLATEPASLPARLWAFQGYFHPATVHFPIALLLVGGLFVVVGLKYPVLGDHVALSCLFIGTASSIVASAMGWAFAVQRGYGSWNRVDMDSEIFWHRWSAIIVTVLAIVISFVALAALSKGSERLRKVWKIGLLGLAAMVGAVGHQGGEMTYGALHYQQAFELIFGKAEAAVEAVVEPLIPAEPAVEPAEPQV
ncbi:MAG TPA: cytochrome C [Planctomycetaceae bacterium]|nr:cytochrome C [Planctomycetaceae bacterium]